MQEQANSTGMELHVVLCVLTLMQHTRPKRAGGFTLGWFTRNGKSGYQQNASWGASAVLLKAKANGLHTFGRITMIAKTGFRVTVCGGTVVLPAAPSSRPGSG
jgi:hypothetical protein